MGKKGRGQEEGRVWDGWGIWKINYEEAKRKGGKRRHDVDLITESGRRRKQACQKGKERQQEVKIFRIEAEEWRSEIYRQMKLPQLFPSNNIYIQDRTRLHGNRCLWWCVCLLEITFTKVAPWFEIRNVWLTNRNDHWAHTWGHRYHQYARAG